MQQEDAPKDDWQSRTNTILIGGVREKVSPYSVKLINVGQHTPLTNPGYCRQTSDGNVFNY